MVTIPMNLVGESNPRALRLELIDNKLFVCMYVESSDEDDINQIKLDPQPDMIIEYQYNITSNSTEFTFLKSSQILMEKIMGLFQSLDPDELGRRSCLRSFSDDRLVLPGNLSTIPFASIPEITIEDIFSQKTFGPHVYTITNTNLDDVPTLLKNTCVGSDGKIFTTDPDARNIRLDYEYVIYTMKPVIQYVCLSPLYVDLIKRKTSNTRYIVYKILSDKISFDTSTNDIIQLSDYSIILNERNFVDGTNTLKFNALISADVHLSFSSDKEFSVIFEAILKKKNFGDDAMTHIVDSDTEDSLNETDSEDGETSDF